MPHPAAIEKTGYRDMLAPMKRNYFILASALILALLAGYMVASNRGTLNIDNYAPRVPGGEFELQSINGPVKLSDFKGKLVLVYFGYTYCPDICPTSLSLTAAALNQLEPEELEQVQALFISVDPARDTVERLDEYAHFFHPSIIGLTGSKAQIDEITKRYGAYYKIVDNGSAKDYPVDHSSQTIVVDKNGKIAATIAHGTLPDKMNETLRKYL